MEKYSFSSKTGELYALLSGLWAQISGLRKRQLIKLTAVMVFTACADVFSIGMLFPFLGLLAGSTVEITSRLPVDLLTRVGLVNGTLSVFDVITVVFCLATLFAGLLRLYLLWLTSRISFGIGSDLSLKIYRSALYKPYKLHISQSSSLILSALSNKVDIVIYQIINPILLAISSLIIFASIMVSLFVFRPVLTLVIFVGFGVIYGLIVLVTKNKLESNSKSISTSSIGSIKIIQEGLGAIRDIIIDKSQEIYCEDFKSNDERLRRAQSSNQFIGGSPRSLVEMLGIILIAMIALIFSRYSKEGVAVIATLGVLALGVQRLLPLLQQLYHSWANITGSESQLKEVVDLLNQPHEKIKVDLLQAGKNIVFSKAIEVKNLGFSYSEGAPFVLKNVNLIINKGERLGIVGPTGSGKSTFLDILMGLLIPTTGTISVDGLVIDDQTVHAWQSKICHVPQDIYLSDKTIMENIAFGVGEGAIDIDKVRKSAIRAELDQTIEKWPEQYKTVVGERGVKLSGGQRQRIGIARALYKQSELIIFDEATSSLDGITEIAVMKSLESISKKETIILVAHRVSTLQTCDRIVEIKNGTLNELGSYEEFIENYNKKNE